MAFSPFLLAIGPLSRALDRWEEAWTASIGNAQDLSHLNDINHKPGFLSQAREFAALARVHLERLSTPPEERKEKSSDLPNIIGSVAIDSPATFDQTGMDHIASLISSLDISMSR